jgi:hypothetical protein
MLYREERLLFKMGCRSWDTLILIVFVKFAGISEIVLQTSFLYALCSLVGLKLKFVSFYSLCTSLMAWFCILDS